MSRHDHPAVLMRDVVGRVLDISPSGCLIESRHRLEVGTVGQFQLKVGNDQCADHVEVVRCEAIEGIRSLYHVGMRFLWTTPRDVGSIRHAVTRQVDAQRVARPARLE